MRTRRPSSEALLYKVLITCDLVYENLNKRYPKDNQITLVRMMANELASFEAELLKVWAVLPYRLKIKTLMVVEEYNFSLLRKAWKSDTGRVYTTRFAPLRTEITEVTMEKFDVIKRGLEMIYSSIDNTYLPARCKERFLNDTSRQDTPGSDRKTDLT